MSEVALRRIQYLEKRDYDPSIKLPEFVHSPVIPPGELYMTQDVVVVFDQPTVLSPRGRGNDRIFVRILVDQLNPDEQQIAHAQHSFINLRSRLAHGLVDFDDELVRNGDSFGVTMINNHPHTSYLFEGPEAIGRFIAAGKPLEGEELERHVGETSACRIELLPGSDGVYRYVAIPFTHMWTQGVTPRDSIRFKDTGHPADNRNNLTTDYGLISHPLRGENGEFMYHSHALTQILGTDYIDLPKNPPICLTVLGGINGEVVDGHSKAVHVAAKTRNTVNGELMVKGIHQPTHLLCVAHREFQVGNPR